MQACKFGVMQIQGRRVYYSTTKVAVVATYDMLRDINLFGTTLAIKMQTMSRSIIYTYVHLHSEQSLTFYMTRAILPIRIPRRGESDMKSCRVKLMRAVERGGTMRLFFFKFDTWTFRSSSDDIFFSEKSQVASPLRRPVFDLGNWILDN